MKLQFRALVSAAVVAFLPALPAAHAAESSVSFDFGQAHPFTGIGAQVWTNTKNPSQAMAMLRDINARYVRVSLMPKIPEDQLGTNVSVEQLSSLIDRADSNQQRQNYNEFRDRMNELRIQPVLIVWRMPRPWMSMRALKKGPRKEAGFADPARIQDYANYITAQLLYVRKMGIQPAGIELTNEPHGGWDTKYDPRDYADLVAKARATFDRYGLNNIRIIGPGTSIPEFDRFYAALRSSGAARNLGYVSAHVYLKPEVLQDRRTPGMANFLGRGSAGPIFITEYGVKQHFEDRQGGDDDDDVDLDSVDFAMDVAATSLTLIGQGATALIYYQLEDQDWMKKKHGLLNDAGKRRPVAQAMQTMFQKLPTDNATAVYAQGAPAALPITAFQSNGRVVLLAANMSTEPQSIKASFSGLAKAPTTLDTSIAFPGGAALRGASFAGGVLQASIAPRSVAAIELR